MPEACCKIKIMKNGKCVSNKSPKTESCKNYPPLYLKPVLISKYIDEKSHPIWQILVKSISGLALLWGTPYIFKYISNKTLTASILFLYFAIFFIVVFLCKYLLSN